MTCAVVRTICFLLAQRLLEGAAISPVESGFDHIVVRFAEVGRNFICGQGQEAAGLTRQIQAEQLVADGLPRSSRVSHVRIAAWGSVVSN